MATIRVPGGGGASFSTSEDEYYHLLAAKLDPAAHEMIGNWPFTLDRDLYVMGAWNLSLTGQTARRYDQRIQPPLMEPGLILPSGTTIGQNQADGGQAMLLACDPSAVSYDNPREKFFERLQRIKDYTLQSVQDDITTDTTDYTKMYSGWSFYGGKPPMLDSGNREYITLTRDNPEGASQTLRWQGYGHTLPAGDDTVRVRLWLERRAGYSGDISVRIGRHTSLAPEGTYFSNAVTIAEENLPAIGAGPQPVEVDVPLTAVPDAYSLIHVETESGSGNCVDWHKCYGKRSATQTNVAARYYDGAAWQTPSWGNVATFAFSVWEDGVDPDPDDGLLFTSAMCYNGAWINIYGHCQTNGLAFFHEVSDADPWRHGNTFLRAHKMEWGDMMGLLRDGTTLPARGQLTWIELPSDW